MDPISAPDEDPADETLALAAGAGNRAAFEQLVFRFGAALLGVIEKQVGDSHLADDLAQEIWIKVFKGLGKYRPQGSLRSWLFSIALNHVRDANRRRARSRVVYIDDFRSDPDATPSVDPRGRVEEAAAIEAALDRIQEPFRTAITLVDIMNFSYEEAATSLDCAVGTVKSRVNRGRFAFRDHYLRSEQEGTEQRPAPPLDGSKGRA
ncbi:MAG: RNA polymerase sigma factor [Planctomycetota bacterium]